VKATPSSCRSWIAWDGICGRPYTMTLAKIRLAMAALGKPETNVASLCAELGNSWQTLYRHVSAKRLLRADHAHAGHP
jgi:hypothetical protein